jgi:hypothetical protein
MGPSSKLTFSDVAQLQQIEEDGYQLIRNTPEFLLARV